MVTLFVQLYESNTDAVKSEIATFLEVFPNGIVWGNTKDGRGYDLVLLGQVEPMQIDVDAIQAKLQAAGVRAGRAIAQRNRDRTRRSTCSRPTPAAAATSAAGRATRSSIAIATCACSTSPGSA